MSRNRKLLSLAIALAFSFGLFSLGASAATGSGCRRTCPATKKHNGYTCTFVGCDAATGACLYAC